jgi:hypothetical protein
MVVRCIYVFIYAHVHTYIHTSYINTFIYKYVYINKLIIANKSGDVLSAITEKGFCISGLHVVHFTPEMAQVYIYIYMYINTFIYIYIYI